MMLETVIWAVNSTVPDKRIFYSWPNTYFFDLKDYKEPSYSYLKNYLTMKNIIYGIILCLILTLIYFRKRVNDWFRAEIYNY